MSRDLDLCDDEGTGCGKGGERRSRFAGLRSGWRYEYGGVIGGDGDGMGWDGGLQGSGVGGRLKGRRGGELGWDVGRSLDLLGEEISQYAYHLAGWLAEVARTWPDRCPGFTRLR